MKLRTCLFLVMAPVAACANVTDDTEAVSNGSEAILNGTRVATDSIGTPHVQINTGTATLGCSGTMITPTWMLTANHCVTVENSRSGGTLIVPSSLRATIKGGPNSPTGAKIIAHPYLDAALVQLSAAPLDAANHSFTNRFYKGSTRALASKNLYVQGWGSNMTSSCSDGGSGSGTLRSATLPISAPQDSYWIGVGKNSSGQMEWHGDSGGSIFATVNNRKHPASVTSYPGACINGVIDTAMHVRGDAIRGWVEGVTGTSPANVTV